VAIWSPYFLAHCFVNIPPHTVKLAQLCLFSAWKEFQQCEANHPPRLNLQRPRRPAKPFAILDELAPPHQAQGKQRPSLRSLLLAHRPNGPRPVFLVTDVSAIAYLPAAPGAIIFFLGPFLAFRPGAFLLQTTGPIRRTSASGNSRQPP